MCIGGAQLAVGKPSKHIIHMGLVLKGGREGEGEGGRER